MHTLPVKTREAARCVCSLYRTAHHMNWLQLLTPTLNITNCHMYMSTVVPAGVQCYITQWYRYTPEGISWIETEYCDFILPKLSVCKQMEHVITPYLRQGWDKNEWLYEGQHRLRPEYSCESQVITVCQDIADSLDNGDKIDAIIVDFSKAFDLVPHGRLLTKIANSGVDSRVVVWIREFLLGRTQRVRLGGRVQSLSACTRCTLPLPIPLLPYGP